MDKNLLEFIKSLSLNDKKSLSKKALKTTEEVGELAKAVLPYENAAGTLHRFVGKKAILDSSADIILCALSIAYDLGYNDQDIIDMMNEKAIKWSGLQVKESSVKYPLPYEIHITIENSEISFTSMPENIKLEYCEKFIEKFKFDCESIKIKPIVLELEKNNTIVMKDVMTSSKHYGDNTTVQKEADRIVNSLKNLNYKIVRVKIETVPWHPAAPKITDKHFKMGEGNYFESHLRILTTKDKKEGIDFIAKKFNAHLSRNYFKKINDEQYIIMMTLRVFDQSAEQFEQSVNNLKNWIIEDGFVVDKVEIEFALYDTNINHDNDWIK